MRNRSESDTSSNYKALPNDKTYHIREEYKTVPNN